MTWQEIVNKEEFKKFSNDQKLAVAQAYWDKVISQDEKFKKFVPQEKEAVYKAFTNSFQKSLYELTEEDKKKQSLIQELLPPETPTAKLDEEEVAAPDNRKQNIINISDLTPEKIDELREKTKVSSLSFPEKQTPVMEPEKPKDVLELAQKYDMMPGEVIVEVSNTFKALAPKIEEEREKGKKVGWDYTPSEAYALYIHKNYPELENAIGMDKKAMAFVSSLIDKTPIGIFTGLVAPIMGAKREGRIWEQAHPTEALVGGIIGDIITLMVGYKTIKPMAALVKKSQKIISSLQRIKDATRVAQTADALIRTAQVWGLSSLARDLSDLAKGETDKNIAQIIKDATISAGSGAVFGGGLAYATGAASLPRIYIGRGIAGGLAGAGSAALKGGSPKDVAMSGFTMALFGILTTPGATKNAKLQAIRTARDTYAKYLNKTKRQLAKSLKDIPQEVKPAIREQYLKGIGEVNKQVAVNLAKLELALKSGKYLPKDFNDYANNLLNKLDNTLSEQQSIIDRFVEKVLKGTAPEQGEIGGAKPIITKQVGVEPSPIKPETPPTTPTGAEQVKPVEAIKATEVAQEQPAVQTEEVEPTPTKAPEPENIFELQPIKNDKELKNLIGKYDSPEDFIKGQPKIMNIGKLVPLKSIKPSQEGEDLYSVTSKGYAKGDILEGMGTKEERSINVGTLTDPNQLPAIIIDENNEIVDGNQRWAAAEMSGLKKIRVVTKQELTDIWNETQEAIPMTADDFVDEISEIDNLIKTGEVDNAHKSLFELRQTMLGVDWKQLTPDDRTMVLQAMNNLEEKIGESKETKLEMKNGKLEEVSVPTYAEQFSPMLQELGLKYEGIQEMPSGKMVAFKDSKTGEKLLVSVKKASKEAFQQKMEESRSAFEEGKKVERGEIGKFKNSAEADDFLDRIVQRVYLFSNETDMIQGLIENQKDIVKNLTKEERAKFDNDLQQLIGTNAIYNRMSDEVKSQVKDLNLQINNTEAELERNTEPKIEQELSEELDKLEDAVQAIEERELERLQKGQNVFADNTDIPLYDRMIPGKSDESEINYQFFEKGKEAMVLWMTPDEYFDKVAAGFEGTVKTDVEPFIDEGSQKKLTSLIMNGSKIHLPFLDYSGKFSQEGRNRAMAVKNTGIEKMPVLVVRKVNEKDIEEKVRSARTQILKDVDIDSADYLKEAKDNLRAKGYPKDIIDRILDEKSIALQMPKFRKSGKLLPREIDVLKDSGEWNSGMTEELDHANKILASIDEYIRTQEGINSKSSIVNQITLNDAQTTAMHISEKFFNVPAIWVKNNINSFEGVYRDGYMFLNVDGKDPIGFVVFHEGVHGLKDTNPGLYTELMALFEYSMDQSDIDKDGLMRFYKKQGIPKRIDQVIEEALADYVAERRGSQEFWNEMIEKAPNLWQRLWAYFKKLIEKIKSRFGDKVSKLLKDTEALDKKVDTYFNKIKDTARPTFELTQDQKLLIEDYYFGGNLTPAPLFIRGFHGTNADFERFSKKYIGKGEGFQAFGHGLYFGGRKGVAQFYADALGGVLLIKDGKVIFDPARHNNDLRSGETRVRMGLEDGHTKGMILKELENGLKQLEVSLSTAKFSVARKYYPSRIEGVKQTIEDFKAGKYSIKKNSYVYEVELWEKGDPLLLDWHRTVPTEQHGRIRCAIREIQNEISLAYLEKVDLKDEKYKKQFIEKHTEYSKWEDVEDSLPLEGCTGETMYLALSDILEDEGASILLEGAGFDGIKYKQGTLSGGKGDSYNYVVFDDAAIKIIAKNGDPLFFILNPDSVKPVYYSHFEQILKTKFPGQMKAQSVHNFMKKYQVKDTEMDWMGLDDFLEGKETVTKQELHQFFNENLTVLEFKDLKDPTAKEIDELANKIYDEKFFDEIEFSKSITWEQCVEEAKKRFKQFKEIEYDKWTLPGGTNHHEMLLTLPISEKKNIEGFGVWLKDTEQFIENPDENMLWVFSTKQDAQDVINDLDNPENYEIKPLFQEELSGYEAGHYTKYRNILVHSRTSDFNDLQKRNVLVVEEIQSDWAEEGKLKGFGFVQNTEGWSAKIDDENSLYWNVLDKDGNYIATVGATNEKEAIYKGYEKANKLALNKPGVPDMPFKNDEYMKLAIKSLLRTAVEGNYEGMAITTGAIQNDRYDLVRFVDEIQVWRFPDTGYIGLKAFKDGKITLEHEMYKDYKLQTYIGKELAEKALNAIKDDTEGRYTTIKGKDLSIGGEGMRIFYDKKIPKFLERYIKQWGGKLTTTKIRVEKRDKETGAEFGLEPIQELPFVEITDKMREGILQGQPMFRRSPFKKGVTDAERAGEKTTEGMQEAGMVEGQQEVPSLRLRDTSEDRVEAKPGEETKVKPKKISKAMINRVEQLYYDAGNIFNFENMMKIRNIPKEQALRALEILKEQGRLKPPMPKPIDYVTIKKKRRRGKLPTTKTTAPKVETIKLPQEYITEENTPYLFYWGLSTTNDTRFIGYRIGKYPMYSENGRSLDMIWEEVGQEDHTLAGHLFREYEEDMTQGVLDEIDDLQTNSTPLQLAEHREDLDRRGETAGRTSSAMTDIEYAKMSDEVEEFFKATEEKGLKKRDSYVVALADLQKNDRLEIYNSDLGEFKRVKVTNIDLVNDQIELQEAEGETYYLNIWSIVRATGRITLHDPFRTVDKEGNITNKTEDAFGNKLLEYLGAPMAQVFKNGEVRRLTGIDQSTVSIKLSQSRVRAEPFHKSDIEFLASRGFHVDPNQVITPTTLIYHDEVGWVEAEDISDKDVTTTLLGMLTYDAMIPETANPRYIFVYDKEPGISDASRPIGKALLADRLDILAVHIVDITTEWSNWNRDKLTLSQIKNMAARVIESSVTENKGMLSWDDSPATEDVTDAIEAIIAENKWDAEITDGTRLNDLPDYWDISTSESVEQVEGKEIEVKQVFRVIANSKDGREVFNFDSIKDRNQWLEDNVETPTFPTKQIKLTDKIKSDILEKKIKLLEKDYSSVPVMRYNPETGLSNENVPRIYNLYGEVVGRPNLKYQAFSNIPPLTSNMVERNTPFKNPKELGELLQALRDPRIEHLWIGFVKDNKISDVIHITSGLPHAVQFGSGEFVLHILPIIEQKISNGSADAFFELHNHPSGNPIPSEGDLKVHKGIHKLNVRINGDLLPISDYFIGSYINNDHSFSVLGDPRDGTLYGKKGYLNFVPRFQEFERMSKQEQKYFQTHRFDKSRQLDIYKPAIIPKTVKSKKFEFYQGRGEDLVKNDLLRKISEDLTRNPENIMLVFNNGYRISAVETFDYDDIVSMQRQALIKSLSERMAEYGADGIGLIYHGSIRKPDVINEAIGSQAMRQFKMLWFSYDSHEGKFDYYDEDFMRNRSAWNYASSSRDFDYKRAPKHPDPISRAYSIIGKTIEAVNDVCAFIAEHTPKINDIAKDLYEEIDRNKWYITEGATQDEIADLNRALLHLSNLLEKKSLAPMRKQKAKLDTKKRIIDTEYNIFPKEVKIDDIHRGRVAEITYNYKRYLSNQFHSWSFLGRSNKEKAGLILCPTMGNKTLVVDMINNLINKELPGLDNRVGAYFEPYGGSLVYMLNLDILKNTEKPIYIAVSSKYEPKKSLVYDYIKSNNKEMINEIYLGVQGLSNNYIVKGATSGFEGQKVKHILKNFDKIIKSIQRENVHIVDMDDIEFFKFMDDKIKNGIVPAMLDDSNYAELLGEHSASVYTGGSIEKDPLYLLNKKIPIFGVVKDAGGVVISTNHIEPVLTENIIKEFPNIRSWGYLHQAFPTVDYDYNGMIDQYRPEFIAIIQKAQQGNLLDIRKEIGAEPIPVDDVPKSRYASRFYAEINKSRKPDYDRGTKPEKNTLDSLQDIFKRINNTSDFLINRTETEVKMKKLRGIINMWVRRKGFTETEYRKIYKKVSGHRHLTHPAMTLEDHEKILKAIKKTRPPRVKTKTVITEKTENRILELKKNLMQEGLMDEETYKQILDINRVRFLGYVSENLFTEEKVGQKILKDMNLAVIIAEARIEAKNAEKHFPIIGKRVDQIERIMKKVKLDEKGKPIKFNITGSFRSLFDMEHFVDLMEIHSGIEFGRYWRRIRDAMLLTNRKVDSILDELIKHGGGKITTAKITKDPESLKRIEDLIASNLPEYVKGKPKRPKDATQAEKDIADYMTMVLKGFERVVRYERWMRWYEHDGDLEYAIPNCTPQEYNKAKDIYETQGDIGLRKHLDTRSWGVIGSGYDIGEIFKGVIRYYKGAPGVSAAHLDPQDTIIYKEYERDIISRFSSYVRQMSMRHDLRQLLAGWQLLFQSSLERWTHPAKLKALIEKNVQEMLGHREIPQAYQKFIFELYSLVARVTFVQPRLGIRNTMQNIALNLGFLTNFLKNHNYKLTATDMEFFKTYISNNRGIVRDLLYADYKTNVPGLNSVMYVIDEINMMGRTDTFNRIAAYKSHMTNIMGALSKYPNYKHSERDRRKFEKAARFYELAPYQIRQAYELAIVAFDSEVNARTDKLKKDGIKPTEQQIAEIKKNANDHADKVLARQVAWAITAKVHFNYMRALRDPASQGGDLGRLASNLLVFKKGYMQFLVLEAQKLKYKDVYEGGNTKAVSHMAFRLASLVLKIAVANFLFKKLTGDDEQEPYDPVSVLMYGTIGGLMVGSAIQYNKFLGSVGVVLANYMFFKERDMKQKNIHYMFEQARAMGKLALPFWKLMLQVYGAAAGMENVDKLWFRQLEHHMFPKLTKEPDLEDYYKRRDFVEALQYGILGTGQKKDKE